MLLDQGLSALQSNTVLQLHPGTHTLRRLTFVHDLTNVSIQGVQSASETVIRCAEGIGLAFFNISNLQIQNVTVIRCGLNEERWDGIKKTLHETFHVIVEIPAIVKVAIFLAACEDVSLEHFQVSNTSGIGLLAVSLLGTTHLSDVDFERNRPPLCPSTLNRAYFLKTDHHEWIGGGAYFLYQDYRDTQISMHHNLTITDSLFNMNQDCSIVGLLENYIEISADLVSLGYEIGAGGGLTVMMAQLQYSVDMSITNSTFVNNSARSGGGAHVGLFSGIPEADILFDGCTFLSNGRPNITSSGGGTIIYLGLVRPSELQGEHSIEDVDGNTKITVSNSVFSRNLASSGGGVTIMSHYAEQHVFGSKQQVWFNNCRFTFNHAPGGSALLVHERKSSGFDIGLQSYISDCVFVGNSAQRDRRRRFEVGNTRDYGSVHVRSVNVTLYGNVMFRRNMVTALAAQSSLIHVAGNVTFYENRAQSGAGLQLLSSSLLIPKRGSTIVFQENKAIMFGGAVFVQSAPENFTFVNDDCFLFFEQPQFAFCFQDDICTPENLSISIVFDGNDARIGSMVYGSALETCSWVEKMKLTGRYNKTRTVYENFYDNSYFNHTFYFDQAPSSSKQVSTSSSRLSIVQKRISAMPGEQFTVNVSALDSFGQRVPEVITSNIIGDDGPASNLTSLLGDSGFLELKSRGSQDALVTVFGRENQTVKVGIVTVSLRTGDEIEVFLMPCAKGFTHNSSSCLCDDRLLAQGVSCDVASKVFTVPGERWLGPIKDDITSNDDLTVARCVLNYCKEGDKEVVSEQWDSQCADGFHRSGQLCGKCEDGYSLQLGSYRCAKCTNWYLFLLVLFIIAGFFLVFLSGLLQVSIAEGFLCAILFYSNIVTLYVVFFNTNVNTNNNFRGINFLTSFFSLNFGIESCLYDGMTAQVLVVLQLTFVAYLFVLACIHIFVDKHISLKLIKVYNQKYSPAKIIGTLMIMCYVSLLQASVGILSFTVMTSLDGDVRIAWYVDATVLYFRGFHAFLGVVAFLVLFLYILPLPILLTFCSSRIYRWKYFSKLKPLYDALYAPYKVQYRPWLGVQLFVRQVLFVFAYFLPTPHQLLALALCVVLYVYIQMNIQPYNSWWVNVTESLLMMLVLVLTILTLYFGNSISVDEVVILSVVTALVLISYGIIVAAFLKEFYSRFPNIATKLRDKFRKKETEKNVNTHPQIKVLNSSGQEVNQQELQPHPKYRHLGIPNSPEQEISYTEYREPLLDEGELEVSKSYSVVITPRGSPQRKRAKSSDNINRVDHVIVAKETTL